MKKLLVIAVALLLCVAIMSPALAEYGYIRLSQIPHELPVLPIIDICYNRTEQHVVLVVQDQPEGRLPAGLSGREHRVEIHFVGDVHGTPLVFS